MTDYLNNISAKLEIIKASEISGLRTLKKLRNPHPLPFR